MRLTVEDARLEDVRELRDEQRRSARCQIVRDSILPRGLAQPWVVRADRSVIAYAGIWTEHFPGRLMEFGIAAGRERRASQALAAVLTETGASAIEWQSNRRWLAELLQPFAVDVAVENLLFEDGSSDAVPMSRPDLIVRAREERDDARDPPVPEGPCVVESEGLGVAAGGVLTHYNPPYADLYMEVVPAARGRGIGSFLVQELRRIARARGLIPAARCDPGNEASRRTLLRGGLRECGVLLSAGISSDYREAALGVAGGSPAHSDEEGS